jgi:hypothetical protein
VVAVDGRPGVLPTETGSVGPAAEQTARIVERGVSETGLSSHCGADSAGCGTPHVRLESHAIVDQTAWGVECHVSGTGMSHSCELCVTSTERRIMDSEQLTVTFNYLRFS